MVSDTSKPVTGGGTEEQVLGDFKISDDLFAFSISPAEFLTSRPQIHNLIAGTIVFRSLFAAPSGPNLETLLIQRAASDSFALKWEIPAGTADLTADTSIAGVAVRELWEETQLRTRKLTHSVGLGLPDDVSYLTLEGEAEDARMDPDLNIFLLRVSGLTWAIVTFIADIEDNHGAVTLRPDEHLAWAWVSEDEVKEGRFRHGTGQNLEFVSEAMRMIVLEGFRVKKEQGTAQK
ncbi:unnamed protein product [Clonostachys solani]|uniref:Nudix hydrolase domain-containing protein n=1 Tax=Clonostachys solani TaxID=160281 RepID=A0A9N9ZL27_9HYPO|nr:unnamed protein product [Clonostachys solani]